jgi:hypothetical protein
MGNCPADASALQQPVLITLITRRRDLCIKRVAQALEMGSAPFGAWFFKGPQRTFGGFVLQRARYPFSVLLPNLAPLPRVAETLLRHLYQTAQCGVDISFVREVLRHVWREHEDIRSSPIARSIFTTHSSLSSATKARISLSLARTKGNQAISTYRAPRRRVLSRKRISVGAIRVPCPMKAATLSCPLA